MNTPDSIQETCACRLETPFRLELPPGSAPAGGHPLLVALHFRGGSGERLARKLQSPEPLPYARLFLSGPIPAVIGEGEARRVGYSWYSYTGDRAALLEELVRAESCLLDCLEQVGGRHPVDLDRMVVLGHSQGGYLASFAALRRRNRFRGLVAVSCRIKHEVLGEALEAAAGFPVLGIHGERDRSVLPGPQKEAFEILCDHGVEAVLHLHGGGHAVRPGTWPLVDAFVRRVLQE